MIMQHILNTKKQIEEHADPKEKKAFISIWDFDGTILQGDCSEGYWEHGRKVYKGLAEIGIDRGLSSVYKPGEFDRFWQKYQRLDKEKGHRFSYPYLPSIFYGNKVTLLEEMARDYFNRHLNNYYFVFSLNMIRQLNEHGIDSHIVSASADFFVKGAARSVGLPKDNLNGLRLKVNNGIVSNKVIKPITYADGKIHTIKSIIKKIKQKKKVDTVYILAGFGNSYSTDGPFLAWITQQKKGTASPVAVMINGGTTPAKYHNLFTLLTLEETPHYN